VEGELPGTDFELVGTDFDVVTIIDEDEVFDENVAE
jgi:hypothetical protein